MTAPATSGGGLSCDGELRASSPRGSVVREGQLLKGRILRRTQPIGALQPTGQCCGPSGYPRTGKDQGWGSQREIGPARIFHDLLGFPKTHHWVRDLAHGRRSMPAGKTRKHAWPSGFWSDTPWGNSALGPHLSCLPSARRRHPPSRGVPRPLERPVAPLTAAKSGCGNGSVLTTQAPLGHLAGPLKDPQSHPAQGKGLPTLRPHSRREQHQGEYGDPADP